MNAARNVLYETSVKLLDTARKQAIAQGLQDFPVFHGTLCAALNFNCTCLACTMSHASLAGALRGSPGTPSIMRIAGMHASMNAGRMQRFCLS